MSPAVPQQPPAGGVVTPAAAAPRTQRGLLRPVRELTFSPPLAAGPEEVLEEIRAVLRKKGVWIRKAAQDRIEFEGPVLLSNPAVRSGVIRVDPAAPDRRLWIELRLQAVIYVWPCCIAAVLMFVPLGALGRAFMLLFLAAATALSYASSASAYDRLVSEAARRARPRSPGPGATAPARPARHRP